MKIMGPHPKNLRQVAEDLYDLEPLRIPGKYGNPDYLVPFDELTEEAQQKCMLYAATAIASWHRSQAAVPQNEQDARIRQTVQATVDEWRQDYSISEGKEHRQLVNRVCAAVEAMQQGGVFALQPNDA